jgi:importin subunit beta-1
LAVGSDFKPYLETSLEMLEQVTKMEVDKGDPELVGYLNILRVGCLEGYVGILRALKGVDVNMSGDVKLFEPAVPVIMKYIEGVALDDTRTAECVSACGETTA